ncbi:MAG: tetratricopeptide repeat protein [Pseudomonadota bacterium]
MADDIFLSQEEQDEKAKKWLKENGMAIGLGIALGLGGIFGYNQYRDYRASQAIQASALFEQVLNLVESSNLSNVSTLVTQLKDDHAGTSYAAKAALVQAKQLSVTDPGEALKELDWVMNNSAERPIWHTANIRKARLLLAQGDDLEQVIGLVPSQEKEGFDSHYHEILGDAYAKQGDSEQAAEMYQAAIDSLTQSEVGYGRVLSLKMNHLALAENESETDETAVDTEESVTVVDEDQG